MKLKFVTGGAIAALAAALTFTAVPAAAERPHDGQWQERHERSGDSGQQSRGWQGREQRAAPAQAEPRVQPQAAQEQRSWGQWRGQQQAQAAQQRGQWRQQGQAQPQSVQGQRSWGEGRQDQRTRNWQGQQAQRQQGQSWGERIQRNGTYTDGNRNTTYRDAQRNGSYRDRRDGYRDGYRDGNRQGYRDNRQWDRNWRSNNRYDWQRYRQTNRYVYHVSPYYSPYRNYSYRRLSAGFYLDSLFFGENYWINDPGYYRLPDAYGPYRWVRYYDDALLVDIYTGQVVDVIYDFFW